MSGETISDLRTVLFETLRGLTDKKAPMDIERAKAINETAQVIINSAKTEVDFIRVVGSGDTGFIPRSMLPAPGGGQMALPDGTKVVGAKPGVRVTRHELKG